MLAELHRLLLKNKHLAGMLQAKLVKNRLSLDVERSDNEYTMDYSAANVLDAEIERQLQEDGFIFTEFHGMTEGSDPGSTESGLQHVSPPGQDFDQLQGHHSITTQETRPDSTYLSWNNGILADSTLTYPSNFDLGPAFQRFDSAPEPTSGLHSMYPGNANASN